MSKLQSSASKAPVSRLALGESEPQNQGGITKQAPPFQLQEAPANRETGGQAESAAPVADTPQSDGRNVTITESVGRGGSNQSADVRAIQAALIRVGFELTASGTYNSATEAAIVRFQQEVFNGWSDGLISPGKNTINRLNATADGAMANLPEVDTVLRFGPNANQGAVLEYPRRVLREICAAAGTPSCLITSTARTPEDQARAMYQNLVAQGTGPQYELYGPAGDLVIDEYVRSRNAGNSGAQIQADMAAKIREVGPGRVSRHCADFNTLCVVDISTGSVTNAQNFIRAVDADDRVSNFLHPWNSRDPAFHIEIPIV